MDRCARRVVLSLAYSLRSSQPLQPSLVNSVGRPLDTRFASSSTTGAGTRWLQTKWGRRVKQFGLAGAIGAVGGGTYVGIDYWQSRKKVVLSTLEYSMFRMPADRVPKVEPTWTVGAGPAGNPLDLKLTLFQFQTCPFCCKVRAFLDYYGFPYEVVEVNPVMRTEMRWSKNWKKVPIILASHNGADSVQQINDSSMIISALMSMLEEKKEGKAVRDIQSMSELFPFFAVEKDGKEVHDVMNKYFLMFDEVPKDRTKEELMEERMWRKWADDTLVHVLSPNVYRTFDEALQAFNWFSEWGRWKENFWSERVVVYVGATAMYFIGKRLKKRHALKDDVRQSLYDEARYFTRQLKKKKTPFVGGFEPNLGDLAVYGVLTAIEGCDAFKDLMGNTDIGPWYRRMKEKVDSRSGAKDLAA